MLKTATVAARRAGTLAAGITLLAGDVALAYSLVERALHRHLEFAPRFHVHDVLLGMWPAAMIVGLLVAYAVARSPNRGRRPVSAAAAFAVPAVGAALALPLTIHLSVGLLAGGGQLHAAAFSDYAMYAAGFTALAHVTFAVQVGMRAVQLATGGIPVSPRTIYWTAVVVSTVPGAILLMLPPLAVALTVLPMLPLLHWMERYARADREETWLPTARLVVA